MDFSESNAKSGVVKDDSGAFNANAYTSGLAQMGMFKNNEAFHFMASYAYICLDFKDQT